MTDPAGRRDDGKIIERLLSPSQKFVPLLIPTKLNFTIELDGIWKAVVIHLHRVVDDEVDGDPWSYALWIFS